MKKSFKMGAKLLAMFASACMLFGMVACSGDDDDDNNTSNGGGGGGTPVASISLEPTSGTLYQDVEEGDKEHFTSLTLTPIVQNSNAAIVWSVDKDGIVTLKKGEDTITAETETASGEAITVEAEGVGEVTITATLKGTDKSATAKITVYANTYTEEVLKGIAGKYLAGETKIIIAENGTVTVGDKSSDEPGTVTKNPDDTYTASVMIDSTVYKLTVTKSGEAYTVTKAKIDDGEEVDVTEYKPVEVSDGTTTTKYSYLKDALKAIGDTGTYTIKLEKDTYEEDGLTYSGNASITIEGDTTTEYGADVIIKGKGSSQTGTETRCLLYFAKNKSSNLTLKNVTLQNTTKRAEVTETNASGNKLTQAEALGFDSNGKLIAYNSSFISHQDTIRTVGKSWFYKCHIEGDVDFVWISDANSVVLLEECDIEIASDESTSAYILGGRIAESNTPVAKGHVILGGKITVPSESTSAYLFRHPGGENCWSQGAVVGAKIDGTFTALAKSAANETDDKQFVAWKVDSAIAAANTGKLTNVGTLSDRYKNREYNGRYVILNRVYNTTEQKFENASELWDPASELTVNSGDSITEDKSKNNIFLDYANVTKTSIGDALVVSDYSTTAPTVSWSAKAYGKYDESTGEFTEEKSDITVNVTDAGITSTESTENIYVKVTATKGTDDPAINDYLVLYSLTVTGFTIDNEGETISIAQGSEKQINVKFEPTGATADVTWESNKSSDGVTVENGLIKVTSNATAGTTATITAKVTIGGQVVSKSLTVEVTAGAKLSKFGTSVADADYSEGYGVIGKGEYLVYPVALDLASTSDDYKIALEAKFTYTAARDETKTTNGYGAPQIGVGIIAFKDGAYSGGVYSQEEVATFAGVKGTSGSSWDGTVPSYQPNTVYTMTVTVTKGGNVSFSLTDGTNTATKSSTYSNWFKQKPFNDIVYIGIGGESDKGSASVDISSIKIVDGTKEYGVSALEDAGEDTRTALSGSPTASITLTSENSQNGKGEDETIKLMNSTSGDVVLAFANDTITPSVGGTWVWDADTVKSTSGGNVKTTASFFPKNLADRLTYKAILSQDVTITVTDNRAAANENAFTITYFSSEDGKYATTSTISKESIVTAGTESWKGADGNAVSPTSTLTDTRGVKGAQVSTTISSKAAGAELVVFSFVIKASTACSIDSFTLNSANSASGNGGVSTTVSWTGGATEEKKCSSNVSNWTEKTSIGKDLNANEECTFTVTFKNSSSSAFADNKGSANFGIGDLIIYCTKK